MSKIKEFERQAIKSIIRKCYAKQYDIIYSRDLVKSSHLKDFINQNICSNDQHQQNKIIFISRLKLTSLFSIILIIALKKCCELHQLYIEEDFEKEMVNMIKNVHYPLTLNVDRRNEWHFPLIRNYQEDTKKVNLRLGIPDKSQYWNRCKNCKITYSLNFKSSRCDKCGNRIHLVKEKPSSYLKKKFNEIDKIESNMIPSLAYFMSFMELAKKIGLIIEK